MSDRSFLDWPFFAPSHRSLAESLEPWCEQHLSHSGEHHDTDATCRALVRALGRGGWLRYCVPAAWGGALEALDSRSLCLLRETLARHDALADFAFAMQGLGSGAISLAGTPAQQAHSLPRVAAGEAIAAFALSEPEAGSDVAAMACSARQDGDSYILDGSKTWISNGGIADFYCLFARTGEQPGARGISAFVVDANTPGLHIAERIAVMAPHPLARLQFDQCRIPLSARLGAPGEGFKIAMRTLDIFRASVAAAALGLARRALDEGAQRALQRPMFGKTLADFQLTQAAIAEMATDIDAAQCRPSGESAQPSRPRSSEPRSQAATGTPAGSAGTTTVWRRSIGWANPEASYWVTERSVMPNCTPEDPSSVPTAVMRTQGVSP
jgi:acyl-CoA dehydrogenase